MIHNCFQFTRLFTHLGVRTGYEGGGDSDITVIKGSCDVPDPQGVLHLIRTACSTIRMTPTKNARGEQEWGDKRCGQRKTADFWEFVSYLFH